MMRKVSTAVLVCIAPMFAASSLADEPENQRLPGKAFRRGLKQLGLNDFLDFYIREFPPDDPVQASLLLRELRLNLYSDPSVGAEERLAALAEATDILSEMLRKYPDHEDRFDWQLDLGRDLIFRKAEPYHNNILFRGGTDEDRRLLVAITTDALAVFDLLVANLVAAESQIDGLSIKQFEKLARSGQIERIETLLPKARYFRLWASYYNCLTLDPASPNLAQRCNEIIHYLNDESKLTNIDHGASHYQAQSLLLAGMAYRLLRSSDRAEQFLAKAATVVGAISNFTERHNLKWVVTLAALERVKNYRDTGQFDMAVRILSDFRNQLPATAPDQFNLHFALALLEGTVYRAQANELSGGAAARRPELLLKSRRPLIDLARSHHQYQDEIYASLFELLGDVGDSTSLDSFEKSVLVAGLLREAGEIDRQIKAGLAGSSTEQRKQSLLERAASLALILLEDESSLGLELRPEARFNLAVCRFEQNRTLEAIEQFILAARDHPDFGKSRLAAEYAVRLAEPLYVAADETAQRTLRSYYLQALDVLLRFHRDSPLAPARQFTLAKVLQADGQYSEAAKQYFRVQPDDPKYAEALFRVAECNLLMLRRIASHDELQSVFSRATVTKEAVDRFMNKMDQGPDDSLTRLVARAHLIKAETCMLRPTKLPDQALRVLAGFESKFTGEPDLVGRAMRIRILAHQELGDLDRAAVIIPDYIERDPENAGATLQGLLDTFKEELTAAEKAGLSGEVRRKSEDALLVAKSLYEWSRSARSGLDVHGRRAFKLEYGEALLRTSGSKQALEVFQSVVAEDAAEQPDGRSHNGRALFGLAQVHLQDHKPDRALPYFSRLYRESAEDSDLWWRSLLGEIRCRLALDQDARTLYNLIRQKMVFHPQMGGPELKRKFERLQGQLAEEL